MRANVLKFRIQRSLIIFETGLLQLGQLRLGSKMDHPPRSQKKRKLREKNMIESKLRRKQSLLNGLKSLP